MEVHAIPSASANIAIRVTVQQMRQKSGVTSLLLRNALVSAAVVLAGISTHARAAMAARALVLS